MIDHLAKLVTVESSSSTVLVTSNKEPSPSVAHALCSASWFFDILVLTREEISEAESTFTFNLWN